MDEERRPGEADEARPEFDHAERFGGADVGDGDTEGHSVRYPDTAPPASEEQDVEGNRE